MNRRLTAARKRLYEMFFHARVIFALLIVVLLLMNSFIMGLSRLQVRATESSVFHSGDELCVYSNYSQTDISLTHDIDEFDTAIAYSNGDIATFDNTYYLYSGALGAPNLPGFYISNVKEFVGGQDYNAGDIVYTDESDDGIIYWRRNDTTDESQIHPYSDDAGTYWSQITVGSNPWREAVLITGVRFFSGDPPYNVLSEARVGDTLSVVFETTDGELVLSDFTKRGVNVGLIWSAETSTGWPVFDYIDGTVTVSAVGGSMSASISISYNGSGKLIIGPKEITARISVASAQSPSPSASSQSPEESVQTPLPSQSQTPSQSPEESVQTPSPSQSQTPSQSPEESVQTPSPSQSQKPSQSPVESVLAPSSQQSSDAPMSSSPVLSPSYTPSYPDAPLPSPIYESASSSDSPFTPPPPPTPPSPPVPSPSESEYTYEEESERPSIEESPQAPSLPAFIRGDENEQGTNFGNIKFDDLNTNNTNNNEPAYSAAIEAVIPVVDAPRPAQSEETPPESLTPRFAGDYTDQNVGVLPPDETLTQPNTENAPETASLSDTQAAPQEPLNTVRRVEQHGITYLVVEDIDGLVYIYDIDGTPLGFVRLTNGQSIDDIDILTALIPLSQAKPNPITLEWWHPVAGISAVFGVGVFVGSRTARSPGGSARG